MAKKQTKMSKKVMEEIESNEIQMHSKAYFQILQLSLIAVTGVFMILCALLLVVVFDNVRYGEDLGLRDLGRPGYQDYLQTLPWLAIVFGLLTFLISYTLIKRFDFSYKHKFFTLVGALVFAVAGLSLIMAGSGADHFATKSNAFKGLHTFSRYAEENVLAGEVIYAEDDQITVFSDDGKKVEVHLGEKYRRPIKNYEIGEMVLIVGEYVEKDGQEFFEAYGMKRGKRPLPPHIRGVLPQILK